MYTIPLYQGEAISPSSTVRVPVYTVLELLTNTPPSENQMVSANVALPAVTYRGSHDMISAHADEVRARMRAFVRENQV